MKKIVSEIIIPLGEHKTIYSAQRIVLRVHDLAAGPYLAIEGIDDEPTNEGENKHMFYLEANQIDEFAEICKEMLKDAEEDVK